ncbi:MAG TPA: 4'-phosphopantetheinyl transferase superfamily protein, partial [Alphaproteobacteria bacterium]|nr:4'-phosphopantetheinyl transferase superfamily protein [Alphaproteobacteria bacterium]
MISSNDRRREPGGASPAAPVEVRLVAPPAAPRLDDLERLLSAEERRRAGRFHRREDRAVYVAVHGLLREVLGERLGRDPASLRFEREAGGRPVLAGGGPAFSVSRARGAGLIALSGDGPVGADIERVSPRRYDAAVARRFFAPAERAILSGLNGDAWTAAFFRMWTRKEAILKAQGKGIEAGLARIDTGDPPRVASPGGPYEPLAGWTLRSLELPAPWAGAV